MFMRPWKEGTQCCGKSFQIYNPNMVFYGYIFNPNLNLITAALLFLHYTFLTVFHGVSILKLNDVWSVKPGWNLFHSFLYSNILSRLNKLNLNHNMLLHICMHSEKRKIKYIKVFILGLTRRTDRLKRMQLFIVRLEFLGSTGPHLFTRSIASLTSSLAMQDLMMWVLPPNPS